MSRLIPAVLAVLVATGPLAAQEAVTTVGDGPTPFVVRSTTDIDIIQPALDAFADANPDLAVTYEQWGSIPLFEEAERACDGNAQAADAVWSSAAHLVVALVNRACARPYSSSLTNALPDTRRWRNEVWGLTQEPAVIIYNTDRISGDEVPLSRFALLDLMRQRPALLQGRIATYDIEDSGLGYLFAYADSLEATTFGSLLEGLARSDAIATCCSAEIIDGVSRGEYLIAYNVLGSYVTNAAPANVGIVLPEDYTLFLSRAYMIPRRAANPEAAERFLDFLLSDQGQAILAAAGLIQAGDPVDQGLIPSARRSIPLAPPLLVALDKSTEQQFFARWRDAFSQAPPP
ncbi:extracellular solute-binding protein [Maritimibacter sp. DP1N21-5]|nr:extracellular solute-binding protein [Maritimibacter sp. DP1N21-5]MBV7407803.1 extracellular solute-binding protein [Maritimibacter sp. DP1N21-5]